MPEIIVDQTAFEQANRAKALLAALVDDPKNGLKVQAIIKEKFPDAHVPQLDVIQQVTAPYDAKIEAQNAQIAALQKMIEDEKASRETEKATVSLKSALDDVRAKYALNDDGMAKVVEIMQTQNLAHAPEAAAALFAQSLPKPQMENSRSPLIAPKIDVFGMQGAKESQDWAQLHESPWDFLTDQCVAVHNEFNGLAA